MPAITTLAIADSVPVTRNYAPMSIIGKDATYVDRTTQTIVSGQATVVLTFDPASSKRVTDRISIRLNEPNVQTLNGVPQVVDTARFIGEFIIPPTWTTLQRNNFATQVKNLFANAIVTSMVKDRDPPY